jgi:putative endonuclease
VNRGERRALRHYRLRGYRLVAANVHAGGYELDLVVRRGRRLVVAEVKEKRGGGYGDPLEMVSPEKARRVLTAARVWLGAQSGSTRLDVSFEAVGVRGRQVERVPLV